MALEYAGWALSRYDVSLSPEDKPEAVGIPRLLSTPYETAQLRLFGLKDVVGAEGWPKVLRPYEHAASPRWRHEAPQGVLSPHLEAL